MTRLDLDGERISVDVPAGWDVLVARPMQSSDDGQSASNPVLHAANFPLPARRGDFGSGAVELMGPDDVFVSLFEYSPDSVGQPLFAAEGVPRRLDPDLFNPNALQRAIPGQAGYQRFFTEQDRAFCVYVVLGSYANRGAVVPSVEQFLAGIDIQP